MLSEQQRGTLLDIARRSIQAAANAEPEPRPEAPADPALASPGAAFVTIEGPLGLRGCIGLLEPTVPLYLTIAEMAYAAACRDPRFPPLQPSELPDLHIEISVLSPLQPILPDEVEPGKHGLVIRQGFRSGALLPQVASKYGWSREEFLCQTCLKAGLPSDAWRHGAEILAFTAEVFGAPFQPG